MFNETKTEDISQNLTTYPKRLSHSSLSRCKKSSFHISPLVNLQSHTRWNLFSRNYGARGDVYPPPFSQTFRQRGASLSDGGRYTRVFRPRLSRSPSFETLTDRARIREVNCLCRTRVVKKQLLAATVFAEPRPGTPVGVFNGSRRRAVDSQRK